MCDKKPRIKPKDPPIVHVSGTLSDLILGKQVPVKYDDPGNPIISIQIQGHNFPNTLVDLGAAINILNVENYGILGITTFKPTTIMFELANRSTVIAKVTLEDIIVSVDSYEYLVDFLVINPRNQLDGHPLILGRSWLATADAYIRCQIGNMTIEKGTIVKNLILYPPAKPSLSIDNYQTSPPKYQEENLHPRLTLDETLTFKRQTEDDVISVFINQSSTIGNPT